MANMREATLTIKVDSRQAKAALDEFLRTTEGVSATSAKAEAGIGRIIKSLAALGVTYKGLQFGREVLALADQFERASRLFNAAFDGMTERANLWVTALGQTMKFGRGDVMRAAAQFQIMFENMGHGAEAAFEMSRGVTELAAKLQVVYGLSGNEAFAKLQSGLMGNVRALRELGITVNETLVEQYALQQGWIDQGQKLTETGRIYATYRYILEQTGKATGTLTEATGSYGEQMRRMRVHLNEIKESVGLGLAPTLAGALAAINEQLEKSRATAERWARDFTEGVGMVGSALQSLRDQDQSELAAQWKGLSPKMQQAVAQAYQSQKGEPAGYKTVIAQGSIGGGAAIPMWQPVSDPAYLRKLIESYQYAWYGVGSPERQAAQQRAGRTAAAGPAAGPVNTEGAAAIQFADDSGARALLRTLEQERKLLELSNLEREKANALYSVGIDRTKSLGDETTKLADEIERQVELLYRAKQQESAARRIEDLRFERDLLAMTNQERQKAIILKELEIEATDELADAIGREIQELEKAQRLARMADDVGHAFGRAFEDMVLGARDAGEAINALMMDIARAVIRNQITQPLANAIRAGLQGAFSSSAAKAHSGWDVGSAGASTVRVPATLFWSAPRLHDGLASDEFPAILQRGERVLSRKEVAAGSAPPSVTVNVINQSSSPVSAEASNTRIDINRIVTEVILKDQRTGGPISRNLGQGRR